MKREMRLRRPVPQSNERETPFMISRIAPRLCSALLLCAITTALPAAAQNVIQLENQKTGTADWAAYPDAANREIEGYASLTSVNRGGTISFYVNTAESSYTLEIFRLGWYNSLGARRVLGPITRPGVVQTVPAPDANGMVECHWTAPYTITIPNTSDPTDWASGTYVVRLTANTSGTRRFIFFVVRDDGRSSNHHFVSAVNTSEAYNAWGGKSLYTFNSTNSVAATKVSFNRPFANGAGTGDFLYRWEYNMVRFLEREGYDVTYCTDVDLSERGNLLLNHKDLLVVGHSEYWSWEMRRNVEAARDQGVNLAFFAGNSVYWQIRYEPSPATGAADRTIVGYKETALTKDPYATDKDSTNNKYVTTSWRSSPVNDSEDALVGTLYFYDAANCCGDITIDDVTSAPWVFTNTGLTTGSKLPGLLGYEVDKIGSRSPANIRLGHSPFTNTKTSPQSTSYSDMTLYQTAAGTLVFSTGSIQWAWGLDDWLDGNALPAAQQMTRNLLTRYAGSGAGNDCQYSVSPASATATPAAGTGSFTLTTAPNCTWTAASNQPWLTLTSQPNGTGPATISYNYSANGGPQRGATITAATATFSLTQGSCSYSLNGTGATTGAAGGPGSVTVTSTAGCPWSASSPVSWITITSGASGTGNGTVQYSVAANDGPQRSASLLIGGQPYSIVQSGGCTYSLSSSGQSVPAAGANGSFTITPGNSQCAWNAVSDVPWVAVTQPSSGTGTGSILYSVAANPGDTRIGHISAGGQTYTITQANGCTYQVSSTYFNMSSAGGSQTVTVTTDATCHWTSSTRESWITVTTGSTGVGNGSVTFNVAANSGGARQGQVGVAGNAVIVDQATGVCTYSIAPQSASYTSAAGAGQVTVTAPGGCSWSASSNAPWITITSTTTPNGNGTVSYSVAPNTGGASRSGTLTITGQTFTVTQSASAAKGDFNGDGSTDVLWRNPSTGANAVWLLNRTAYGSTVNLPGLVNSAYHFEGTADFNGDGQTDIVLRNESTGANALWVMNGTSVASVVNLPALPNAAYHIQGTGDFDGDGRPDIIWRNVTTGANAVWIMDGTTLSTTVNLPALPSPDYHLESAGDFNGDGKPDIVWRNNTTGANALWLMNGTSYSSTVDLPGLANPDYRIAGIADFDGDGRTDILWRNVSTGAMAIWKMNGTSFQSIVDLPPLPNPQYEVGGPR
jgi:hypothetical protein